MSGGKQKRVALAVMDFQTLHRGHNNLLSEMRMTCDRAIVGVGSVRKFGTPGHPFNFDQRVEMVRMLHGSFFEFVALDDIDASYDMRAWYDYVKMKISRSELPEPTDYFGGSVIDAKWYFHAFASPENDPQFEAGITTSYLNRDTGRRLHLVDRKALGLPSGREVRLLIETRDEEWKRYVPERLHDFIEENYPPHLRQPLKLPDAGILCRLGDGSRMGFTPHPKLVQEIVSGHASIEVAGDYPVGTRLSLDSDGTVPELPLMELKDDGRWRPLDTRDEKAEWALAKEAAK